MRFYVLIMGFILFSCSTQANTILGLCGTGRTVDCGALQYDALTGTGGQQDGNYTVYKLSAYTGSYPGTLVTANNIGGHPVVLSISNQYGPGNAWVDYNTGRWVAPVDSAYNPGPDPGCAPGSNNSDTCKYYAMYYISFNLPIGIRLSGVSVTGSWAPDDKGYIVVNGNSLASRSASQGGEVGNTCPGDPFCGAGAALASFTLTNATGAGFVAGSNYIGFVVDQADNYFDGVDVNSLSGSYDAVPEPATWGLLAAGALALGIVRRRLA